ncbi:MAG: hypothetical protein LBQ98_01610 [Nitrososphaerota archaeon]|jgi:transposase-like protein|nr:hypothetical protein [Nitrososphaerota archaeon]
MVTCKKCLSEQIVKNGIIRGKQRYQCKDCEQIFVEGDQRTNEGVIAKKAMCTLLYSLGKISYNKLAQIFETWPSLIYRWIVETGANQNPTQRLGEIKELEFDEMLQFVGSKKVCFESKKPLTVAHGELWPGCRAIVILQPSSDAATQTNI